MKVTSLENSIIFCDQERRNCREWALFLKCPQTWGVLSVKDNLGVIVHREWCGLGILRGRKGKPMRQREKNWNVNFVKLKGKVKILQWKKKKKSSDLAISKGKQHIPFLFTSADRLVMCSSSSGGAQKIIPLLCGSDWGYSILSHSLVERNL